MDEFLGLVVGPSGGLVLAVVCLILLVRGNYVVPYYVYAASESAREMLEEENKSNAAQLAELAQSNADLRVSVARMEQKIEHMSAEIVRLRGGGG